MLSSRSRTAARGVGRRHFEEAAASGLRTGSRAVEVELEVVR